jgi:hypothetical protein
MLPRSPIQMKRNSGGGGGVKKRVRSGGEKQRRLGFRRSGSGLRAGGLFACGVFGNYLCQTARVPVPVFKFHFSFFIGRKAILRVTSVILRCSENGSVHAAQIFLLKN